MPVIVGVSRASAEANWYQGEPLNIFYTEHMRDHIASFASRAARRARLAHLMADFLLKCDGEGVRDRGSAAFSASFFTLHGSRLFARARELQRPISLVGVDLSAETDKNRRHKAMREAVSLIRRMTRAGDMTVRLNPTRLAVLTPGVIDADAPRLAERVKGVLSGSLRISGDVVTAGQAGVGSLEESVAALVSTLDACDR